MPEPDVTPPSSETPPTPPISETPPPTPETPKPEGEAPPPPVVETPPAFEPLTSTSFKLSEGLEATPEVTDKFIGILNNTDLAPDARAQALVDLQGEVLAKASEANSKAWNDLQSQWQTEVKADPEIGGAKFEATLTSIGKLVDQYGTLELREAMDMTGAGNNPHVIRFLSKVAGLLTEGGPVSGSPGVGATSPAERMFPSMKGK